MNYSNLFSSLYDVTAMDVKMNEILNTFIVL